jgi:hypothetical protein
MPQMMSGYAFLLIKDKPWTTARSTDWEVTIVGNDYTTAQFKGKRKIDENTVNVFQIGNDFWAQSEIYTN